MKTVTNLDFAPDMDNLFTSSTPVWEQMWEHRIFDALEHDDEGNVIDTPIDTDKPLGQSFKAAPKTNSFNVDEGEYWIPTDRDITTEYIKNDVIHRLDYVTYKSIKVETFMLWLNKVHSAKSPSHLGYIGYEAHQAIQASVKSFIADDEAHEAPTLFPSDHLKIFWKGYKLRKASLAKANATEIADIEAILATELTVQELEAVRQGIYATKLSYKEKQAYRDICDERIATLSA